MSGKRWKMFGNLTSVHILSSNHQIPDDIFFVAPNNRFQITVRVKEQAAGKIPEFPATRSALVFVSAYFTYAASFFPLSTVPDILYYLFCIYVNRSSCRFLLKLITVLLCIVCRRYTLLFTTRPVKG